MQTEELNSKITIKTDDGKDVVYTVLFKHYSKEFDKTYAVFVEDGTNNASAAIVVKRDGGEGLEEIKSQEEWTMLEGHLNKFIEEQKKIEGSACSSCSSCSACSSCEDFDDDDFEDEDESCSCQSGVCE